MPLSVQRALPSLRQNSAHERLVALPRAHIDGTVEGIAFGPEVAQKALSTALERVEAIAA